jgi:hypothetical protein
VYRFAVNFGSGLTFGTSWKGRFSRLAIRVVGQEDMFLVFTIGER